MKKEKKSEAISKVLDNIKALRAIKNYSQQNIADKLGCDYSTYGKIENGQSGLTVARLIQLAEIFEVEVPSLLFGYEMGRSTATYPGSASSSSPKIIIEIPLNGEQAVSINDLMTKKLAKN